MIKRTTAILLLAQLAAFPTFAQTLEPAPAGQPPVAAQKPAPVPAKPVPAKPAPLPPVSADPATISSANFGDWTLRCSRTAAAKACEIVTTIQMNGQNKPIAGLAFTKSAKNDPIHITAHLPITIALPSVVKFTTAEKDAKALEIPWKRCIPIGCFADTTVTDAQWKNLHNQTDTSTGSLEFIDGSDAKIKFNISFRGLPQAIDALAKD